MRNLNTLKIAGVFVAGGLFLAACGDDAPPSVADEPTAPLFDPIIDGFEDAEEAIEDTADEAQDAAEDAYEATEDAVEDAYDATEDAAEDAADEVRDAIDD